MNQEITCPKCSYKFALDEALNRDFELQIRAELNAEFTAKEAKLRRQLTKEAAEKADRDSAELHTKLEAQAKELKEAREYERALLRRKAELEEQAAKAHLEAERTLSNEREKIRKVAQDQVLHEHRLKDAEKNKQHNLSTGRMPGRDFAGEYGAAGADSIVVKWAGRPEIENLSVLHQPTIPRTNGDNCGAV